MTDRPVNERIEAMIGVIAVHALLGIALLLKPGHAPLPATQPDTALFDVREAPPPRPIAKPIRTAPKPRSGKASPANLHAKPLPFVAPPLPHLTPQAVPAATIAGLGRDANAGASNHAGPGTGAGGIGNGLGSGGAGDGEGDGGGGSPPRQIRGKLKFSDAPDQVRQAGIGGTVGVRFTVEADGRVSACSVTASSGTPALDSTTCRLIQQRFQFRPARDEDNRPVRSTIIESHSWVIERADQDEGGRS